MPWWDGYFGELYLRMFDTVQTAAYTAQEVAGIMAALDLGQGTRLLDLCCGQGRHAVLLARAGCRVSGLDFSAYMLDRARSAASAAGVHVDWVRGDMRSLPWRHAFDACINVFTSFGYFKDEADNLRVLRQVSAALRPGGKFLLDLSNRDYYLMRLWPKSWRHVGGAVILEETAFDPVTCRFRMTSTWLEAGRAENLSYSVRYYTVPEVQGMLERAGLAPVALYGDFDGSEFGLNSQRLIVVAEKA